MFGWLLRNRFNTSISTTQNTDFQTYSAYSSTCFLSGLWLSEHNNTMDLQSTSLSLQRHIIHAKSIKLPHFHVFSSACVKNRNHFCNFLKTISLAVCWSYLLILLAGDVELNPGPQSADISSSTESFNDYMNVSVFEKNFSLVHYNV